MTIFYKKTSAFQASLLFKPGPSLIIDSLANIATSKKVNGVRGSLELHHVMVMMISHQTEATNKSGWDIMASWHHDFIAIPDLARCDVVASRSQSAGNELVFKLPVDVNENLSDSIVKLVDHVLTSQCLTCLHSTPGQVRMIEEATAWTRTACFSKFVIFIQGFGSISHVQPCEHFFNKSRENHVAASTKPRVIQPCQLWFRQASEDFLAAFLRPRKVPCTQFECHSSQVVWLHHLSHVWCSSWSSEHAFLVPNDSQGCVLSFFGHSLIRFSWGDAFIQQAFNCFSSSFLEIPNFDTDLNQTRILWFWEPDANQTRSGVTQVGKSQKRIQLLNYGTIPCLRCCQWITRNLAGIEAWSRPKKFSSTFAYQKWHARSCPQRCYPKHPLDIFGFTMCCSSNHTRHAETYAKQGVPWISSLAPSVMIVNLPMVFPEWGLETS